MRAIFILVFLCSPAIAAPVPKELRVAQAPKSESSANQKWPWPADGQSILKSIAMPDPMPSIVVKHHGARLDAMRKLSEHVFASDEAKEGIAAFLNKRPPSWRL